MFSEYTEANSNAVTSWINGDSGTHDWSSVVEYVVKELEWNSSDKAVSIRVTEMKRKISSVVPCNITERPIVRFKSQKLDKLFEVVSTTLCLDYVSTCLHSPEIPMKFIFTEEKLCKYTSLPNVQSSIPRIFKKLLKPVYANVRGWVI